MSTKKRIAEDRGLLWLFVLAGLMVLSLLAFGEGTWAAPGQSFHNQTVPTPPTAPSPPKPTSTSTPSKPTPPAPPTASPTATPPLTAPLPTSTLSPTTILSPTWTPSPTVSFTLSITSPTPLVATPEEACDPLEKFITPFQETRFDLLEPCRILVEVPSEAVSETLPSRLVPRLLTEAPPSQPPLQMRSVAFTFEVLSRGKDPLVGFIFNQPYTATVSYIQTDLEVTGGGEHKLVIAYFNEAAKQWRALDSRVDPVSRLVSARWDQPGWLALMMRVEVGTPVSQPLETPDARLGGTSVPPAPSVPSGEVSVDPASSTLAPRRRGGCLSPLPAMIWLLTRLSLLHRGRELGRLFRGEDSS